MRKVIGGVFLVGATGGGYPTGYQSMSTILNIPVMAIFNEIPYMMEMIILIYPLKLATLL